mmetsp:Transcript_22614/g.27232  ORF Transcript_22614/g.27232 Transcript_22614/m.27232 type:complete len:97 (-) Transcript_22614:8-298(-)
MVQELRVKRPYSNFGCILVVHPLQPREKKILNKTKVFFKNFAATIADNAAGSVDPRPKDEWGNPKQEQTLITPEIIFDSELAEQGFTEEAYKKALL